MAITLPGLTINDDIVAEEILAAFSDGIDPVTMKPIPAEQTYQEWVRVAVVEFVCRRKTEAMADKRRIADEAALKGERGRMNAATKKP